ncbi:hypothetical protein GCM10009628_11010 [Paeniglutamicibacter kerguelensis]|uniref:Uncharacterized protein n=1 Tax=Paeniglutamicibacter kerguelensis TaxID=254788 RepID=A0ABS4XCV7_9MICC|nr:hypothetical protein [Paeniglutamicibacter kerguelensis]
MGERYDALLWILQATALHPLHNKQRPEEPELETEPTYFWTQGAPRHPIGNVALDPRCHEGDDTDYVIDCRTPRKVVDEPAPALSVRSHRNGRRRQLERRSTGI